MRYVGYQSLCAACFRCRFGCAGAMWAVETYMRTGLTSMWDFTSYMRAVVVSMWADTGAFWPVTASMLDATGTM